MARGKITGTYHFRVEINKPDEKVVKYYYNCDDIQEAFGISRPTLYRKLKGGNNVKKLKDVNISQGKFHKFKTVVCDLN